MGNENFTAAPSGTFRTRSGLLNISANEQKQFEALCDLVGRPDLKTDVRYADRHSRKVHRESLSEELSVALVAKPADEWEIILNRANVPAGRILSVGDALTTEQVRGRAFVEELPRTEQDGGTLRITRPGILLDSTLGAPVPPPALGAHTRRWLERVGYGPAEIESLLERGIARSV
jgi:CoA:oxalate CoA-transferase